MMKRLFRRVNQNLWSPGLKLDRPWTQRGWTSAAQIETASCSSVPLSAKTQACTRCLWRWRASRTRLHSPSKLLVRKMLLSERQNVIDLFRIHQKKLDNESLSEQSCQGLLPVWRSWIPGASTWLWSGLHPPTTETRRSQVTPSRRPTKRLE